MTWLKLDDTFPENPKVLEAGPLAGWLYLCGLAYCARNLTDGLIPKAAVSRLMDAEMDAATLATRLVESGLWETDGKSYKVHDYLIHQRSKAQIEHDRTTAAERQALARQRKALGTSPKAVTASQESNSPSTTETEASVVRAKLVAMCDRVPVDGNVEQTLERYRKVVLELVPEAVAKYADVKGIGEASLQNVVLIHAAGYFLGQEIDQPSMRRLAALRRDYGYAVLEALPKAAIGAKGDPINYLTGILKKGAANA